LIVEDEPALRDLVSRYLQMRGHSVVTAADGEEALRWLRGTAKRPRIILTDLRMPVMDGWRLCAELARDPELKAIPVVIVSSEPLEGPIPGRVVGRLQKPVPLAVLEEVAAGIGTEPGRALAPSEGPAVPAQDPSIFS
jgi:CheY-like chemotaxis protein